MIDIKKALLDPSSVFKTPNDVVNCKEITIKQKIKVLRRWEYDIREQEVAEEENMPNMPLDILSDIYRALAQLGATVCNKHSAPTKQGGE